MSPLWSSFLHHIREECAYVMDTVAPLTFETFQADRTWPRSVIRSLEIIGEATKHLPVDMLLEHPEVPWKQLARLRDRLAHGYFDIDLEIVWLVATEIVPKVNIATMALLQRMEQEHHDESTRDPQV